MTDTVNKKIFFFKEKRNLTPKTLNKICHEIDYRARMQKQFSGAGRVAEFRVFLR